MLSFDVIVVGGGHAGTEAAAAAARMGAVTALITHRRATIGAMSCNPAIGGLGRGHLVREIDALDGLIGRAIDRSGIQFRLLNRRKGPAVRGPRAQADRLLYAASIQDMLEQQPNLTVLEAEVCEIKYDHGVVAGVHLADDATICAPAVVLTTGTFLRGEIHIGSRQIPAGRRGDKASVRLANSLMETGVGLRRLKTGTPPRLEGRSIDFGRLESQPGDQNPTLFSFLSKNIVQQQRLCHVTYTNHLTHEIICENLSASPLHSGQIAAQGVRYCPSIEDKVVRFADRDRHQIFLEPEGLTTHVIYPNGISTSIEPRLQEKFVQSIRGLERAIILQPGYAIEYDHVDPRCLRQTLAHRDVKGLFLAGQINGSTGYEEAAAQGIVAGINAALVRESRCFVLDRAHGYIGVLIDDLTVLGVSEPYRMFTSRAEYRLSQRADNADVRLTPSGIDIGCISAQRRHLFERKSSNLMYAHRKLAELSLSPQQCASMGISVNADGRRRSGIDLLSLAGVCAQSLLPACDDLAKCSDETLELIEIDCHYAAYIARQDREVSDFRREEQLLLPEELQFEEIDGLTNEIRERLGAARPSNLGAASRIPGMTPAALTILYRHAKRRA